MALDSPRRLHRMTLDLPLGSRS